MISTSSGAAPSEEHPAGDEGQRIQDKVDNGVSLTTGGTSRVSLCAASCKGRRKGWFQSRDNTNSVSPFPWNWEVTELESSVPARSGRRGRAVPGLLGGCSIG